MYKRICITNRKLVKGDFLNQISKVVNAGVDIIILREKDITPEEYRKLSCKVLEICNNTKTKLILHSFLSVAEELKYPHIHLTMKDFLALSDSERKNFCTLGVSTHTVEEAMVCEQLGATYITASHIFWTDCKKGLEPKGIEYLKQVKNNTKIPVYALGGINADNEIECISAGADGICKMSSYME